MTIQKTTHQSDDKEGKLHPIEERKMKEMSDQSCQEDLKLTRSEMTTIKLEKILNVDH